MAVLGGGYLLKTGLEQRNEAQIHVQALEELGMSLEAEITPQVIELEDRTVMLVRQCGGSIRPVAGVTGGYLRS